MAEVDSNKTILIGEMFDINLAEKVIWTGEIVGIFPKEGNEAVVEASDLRFARMASTRPSAFTYRVRFGADGNVVSQGWAAQ